MEQEETSDECIDNRSLRTFQGKGLGWVPDYPDLRDYTLDSDPVAKVIPHLVPASAQLTAVPTRVDLRSSFSPIEDQGQLGSCTAQAAIGLLEYYERRVLKRHVNASRLFLYKVTRKLLGWTGDTGAYLRTTMKALALFGTPPEEHYPYDIARFDQEPDAFAYALGQNWQGLSYYRLDPAGTSGDAVLQALKQRLYLGQPAMFGFTVYNSFPTATTTGLVPFPKTQDRVIGGHAVIAAGYDDEKEVDGTKGALIIRNSWGVGWGEKGYGYMPYRFVTGKLANDFWSLVRSEYVDLAPFV